MSFELPSQRDDGPLLSSFAAACGVAPTDVGLPDVPPGRIDSKSYGTPAIEAWHGRVARNPWTGVAQCLQLAGHANDYFSILASGRAILSDWNLRRSEPESVAQALVLEDLMTVLAERAASEDWPLDATWLAAPTLAADEGFAATVRALLVSARRLGQDVGDEQALWHRHELEAIEPFGAPDLSQATGRSARLLRSPDEAHVISSEAADFAIPELDQALGGLVRRVLAGEADLDDPSAGPEALLASVAEDGARDSLTSWFDPEAQKERGTAVPTALRRQRWGLYSYPLWARRHPTVAHGLSRSSGGEFKLTDAGSVASWALFSTIAGLLAPLRLRGDLATVGPAERGGLWFEAEELRRELGLDVEGALEPLRFGSRFSDLGREQMLALKSGVLEELVSGLPDDRELGLRVRAAAARRLASRVVASLKKDGTTTRQRALKGEAPADLALAFGGDWESALTLFEIEAKEAKPKAVAAPPAAELSPVASDHPARAPLAERLAVMREFWDLHSRLHAKALPTEHSLWGLVETWAEQAPSPLIEDLLPLELRAETERLWATRTLGARSVGRLVTALNPYAEMCSTFGAALTFWDRASLTIYYVFAGPYSRTTISGIGDYEDALLGQLAAGGCPVEQGLLDRVTAVAAEHGVADSSGPRGGGDFDDAKLAELTGYRDAEQERIFCAIRDELAAVRREWADRYLDAWLARQMEGPLQQIADDYNVQLSHRAGKAPTIKQATTSTVVDFANRFCGGSIREAYRLVDLDLDLDETYERRMPRTPQLMAERAADQLGLPAVGDGPPRDREEAQLWSLRHQFVRWLPGIWQRLEAGEKISAKLGSDYYLGQLAERLGVTTDQAWRQVEAAVINIGGAAGAARLVE